jgi:NAD(P)-dependent dehydrogenase (short-subunit alcohol dehydrogenase family)
MKRVCLFLGASGRLGTAFCRAHADKYEIVAVYRQRPPEVVSQRQRLVDPLGEQEPPENAHPVFALAADLTRDEELERIVALTLARFDRIDVVIHAAVRTTWAPILAGNKLLDSAEAQLRMNVIVPLKLASIIARQFWQHDDVANRMANRCFINVSSIAANNVYSGSGQSVYSAAKAAMNMLTRHMADEFRAIGVRVNALAPNSFPRSIPTAAVVDGLRQLDEGAMTGKVLVLGRDGATLT